MIQERSAATVASATVAFLLRSPWVWIAMPGPLVSVALGSGGAGAAFASYHLWCLLGVLCLGGRGGAGGRFLFPVWWPFAVGIVLAGLAWVLAGAGFPVGGGGRSLRDSLGRLGVSGTTQWWMFSYFCVVNPLIEEWFWRGAVSRWFRECGRPVRHGAGIASLCFAVWHAVPMSFLFAPWVSWCSVLVLAALGYGAECLRRRGSCLWELAMWHGVAVDFPIAVWLARVLVF